MVIYRIYNKNTGKSYIGKSVNYLKRYKDHKKAARNRVNRRLYDSMNYHGINAFELTLVEELGNVSKQEADVRETFWIAELDTLMPNGYNMTIGGEGGNTLECWPDERKKKLWEQQAKARIGNKHAESSKEKMREAAFIREASKSLTVKEDIAKKISKTNVEKGIRPPEYTKWKKGQVGTFTNKKHTEHSKNLMSAARKDKTYEDFYGVDQALELKKIRSRQWSKENNPRYVEFSNKKKQQILLALRNNKLTMKQISTKFEITEYKIRQWFREIGVKNFQQLRHNLTTKQWQEFWEEKC
jgi:group I intron endonuclease